METILLATDGSPSAEQATAAAIELAVERDAELAIVTAWQIPISAFGYSMYTAVPELAESERKAAEQALRAAAEAAEAAGLEPRALLTSGEPSQQICAVADELEADLIVIGAHGWNPLERLLLGSISTRVLHHARCPVLVAREGARGGLTRRARRLAAVTA
jgi:nucleotide-binding universal stress UspA family protein